MKKQLFEGCNLFRTKTELEDNGEDVEENNGNKMKFNGWKCMPYIIGNDRTNNDRIDPRAPSTNLLPHRPSRRHMSQRDQKPAQRPNPIPCAPNHRIRRGSTLQPALRCRPIRQNNRKGQKRTRPLLQLVLCHVYMWISDSSHVHNLLARKWTRLYEFVPPEGSVFSGVAQVFIAAFKKRKMQLPAEDDAAEQESLLFNPVIRSERIMKLPLTLQFRCLNKAAINREGELNEDGSIAQPWRLCTVQQIEEVKCLLRIIPIWSSGVIGFIALLQQFTFAVLQGLTMDRHMGKHFEIPPATLGTLSLIALTIFIPIYDIILVPIARKFTRIESGITLLHRQGTGLVILVFSMVIGGLVEEKRRSSALAHGGLSPMSAFWLSPQLIVLGIGEAFSAVGQIEFFNRQFPEHMQSLAGSLFNCTIGGASYISAFIISVVQNNTAWLSNNNINAGKLDYFYYLIGLLGVVNFAYFLICAHFYRYKGVPEVKHSSVIQDVRGNL